MTIRKIGIITSALIARSICLSAGCLSLSALLWTNEFTLMITAGFLAALGGIIPLSHRKDRAKRTEVIIILCITAIAILLWDGLNIYIQFGHLKLLFWPIWLVFLIGPIALTAHSLVARLTESKQA